MTVLQQKVDFAVIFRVTKANPNGDPLNGNRPRTDYDGFGEVTDVCIKRKIRDRLQEKGHAIFVQSADRNIDGEPSLRARAESEKHGLGKDMFRSNKKEQPSRDKIAKAACEKWLDVRAFGQLFAFKDKEGKDLPHHHGIIKLADGTTTTKFVILGVSEGLDGSVYLMALAPYTLLEVQPFPLAPVPATGN